MPRASLIWDSYTEAPFSIGDIFLKNTNKHGCILSIKYFSLSDFISTVKKEKSFETRKQIISVHFHDWKKRTRRKNKFFMATQGFFKCRNQILDSRSDVFLIVHVAICPKLAERPKILSPLVLRIFLVVVRSQKKKNTWNYKANDFR